MNHIALQASAGSGKTFMLSVRYMALVFSGANVNDIVALTFTNKAVNEMKDRITKVFLELEYKEAELNELSKLLSLSKDEILRLRDSKKRSFLEDELRIYTFDSFFSKILRLFATHEGLRVDYELANSIDVKKQFLNSLSKDEAMQIVKNLKKLNMSIDDFINWLSNLALNYTGKYDIKEVKNIDLMGVYAECKDDFLAANNTQINKWLNNIDDIDSLLDSSLLDESKKAVQKCLEEPNFAVAFHRLLDAVARHYAYLEYLQLKLCFKYLDRFFNICKSYHQEENILSFSDVALYVHKILQNQDLKDLFYFRLNSNLNHLLIDEFQDTSIIQYEIIKPIVEEIVSGIGIDDRLKSFFYVGDKKQSIYTFRGAKQEVFDLFCQNKFYNIKLENLQTNYRSKAAIVEFVNKNFKNLYPDGIYIDQLVFSKEVGKVSKIIVDKDNYYDDVYKKIASLLQNNAKLEDICILTRDNNQGNELAKYLASKNLKININSNVLINSNISVRVLIEFAKYCIFGDYAYMYFVKSVLGEEFSKINININDEVSSIYNKIIKHLNIVKDVFIVEFLNDVANANNFLSTLYEMSQSISSDSNLKGINIMTIHKSKGLQFEHVICLEISKKQPNDNGLKIEYDFDKSSWYGFLKPRAAIVSLRAAYDNDYKQKLDKYEKTQELDKINTHYVAYTRAISSLCIIKDENAGLCGIDYDSIDDELLDDELLEYEYKLDEIVNELKQYEFLDNIPLQNVKEKQFNSDAIMLGNAFHYFCELSDFSEENFEECFKICMFKYFQVDEDKLKNLCKKLILNDDFKNLIKGSKLLKEHSFMLNNSINRIDLLAISDDEIKIIDYKSSFFHQEYETQLKRYENFIKDNYKKHKISSYVVFYENDEFSIKKV